MNELILALAAHLRGLDGLVRLDRIYAAFPNREAVEIGEALGLLEQHRLIRTTFQRDCLQLTPSGRSAVDDGSTLDLVLGLDYTDARCSPATVHIIVRGIERDESGGTGFFSADYAGFIITAAHVVRDREILRIENLHGLVLSNGPFVTRLGPERLDIAFISCQPGEGVAPLAIEWREEMIRPMQQLIILGYPEYPLHLPALHHSRAELHTLSQKFGSPYRSMIISSVTRPGFSGGPVISERGRVIGIVEEENIGENENRHPIAFFSAVPAWYSRMIVEGQRGADVAPEAALGALPPMIAPPPQQEG